jgi:hypothetical protein
MDSINPRNLIMGGRICWVFIEIQFKLIRGSLFGKLHKTVLYRFINAMYNQVSCETKFGDQEAKLMRKFHEAN